MRISMDELLKTVTKSTNDDKLSYDQVYQRMIEVEASVKVQAMRLTDLQERYSKLENAYWDSKVSNALLEKELTEWKNKVQQKEKESDRAIDEGLAWIELYQDCLSEIKEIALHVQTYTNPNLEDDVHSDMENILKRIEEMEVHADRKV